MEMVWMLLGLFLLLLVVTVGAVWTIQYRNKKAVVGKVFCTIIQQSKTRVDGLYERRGQEIIVPLPGGGHATYMISPQKTWTTQYPPGLPKLLQSEVPSAIFAEDNPEPLDPFKTPALISAELLGNLSDKRFSGAMVEEAAREERGGELPINLPKWSYAVIALPAVISLIVILLVYLVWTQISAIARMLGV